MAAAAEEHRLRANREQQPHAVAHRADSVDPDHRVQEGEGGGGGGDPRPRPEAAEQEEQRHGQRGLGDGAQDGQGARRGRRLDPRRRPRTAWPAARTRRCPADAAGAGRDRSRRAARAKLTASMSSRLEARNGRRVASTATAHNAATVRRAGGHACAVRRPTQMKRCSSPAYRRVAPRRWAPSAPSCRYTCSPRRRPFTTARRDRGTNRGAAPPRSPPARARPRRGRPSPRRGPRPSPPGPRSAPRPR